MQAVREVAPQVRRQAAQRFGAAVGLEKPVVHLGGRAHPERHERQVRRGQPLERAEVGRTLAGRLFEALDRVLQAFTRALVPEVPAAANQLVGSGHVQVVADLGTVADPLAVLVEAPLHLANGDVDGVLRNERAFPGLRDHLLVADPLAAVHQQDLQNPESLRTEPDFHAVAKQLRRGCVEGKWTEGDGDS